MDLERLAVDLESVALSPDKDHMKTETPASGISPELLAELQEAADKAAKGLRDPEEMRQACERMDRMREEVRQQHGVLDIAVPSIRELRDS